MNSKRKFSIPILLFRQSRCRILNILINFIRIILNKRWIRNVEKANLYHLYYHIKKIQQKFNHEAHAIS